MSKGKIHYAWFVLAGCCALPAGMGLLLNTGGQWFVSVTKELGVGTAQLALYFTIQGLCMAATAPFVGKLLPKLNTRVLLTTCYAICILAVGIMSQYNAVWQWYISGALLGIAGCFVFIIPVPVILGNWFAKKTGFAVGLAMSFSGIAAAIANPIIAMLIADIGWRFAYMAIAIVTAIVVLPCTLFLIRFKPADKKLLPYGAEEMASASAAQTSAAIKGVPAKRAYRSVAFWLLFAICGLFSFLGGFSQILPVYMTTLGLTAIVGLISTMAMIGNVVGKLGLGAISDKFGGTVTGVLGTTIVLIGFLLLIFSGQQTFVALAGALCYGMSLSLIAVVSPILARTGFGAKDFSSLYATLNIGISLIGAFGMTIVSLVFDISGSYLPAFWGGAVLCVVVIFAILLCMKMVKKLPREA